jgi:hypothetical protein
MDQKGVFFSIFSCIGGAFGFIGFSIDIGGSLFFSSILSVSGFILEPGQLPGTTLRDLLQTQKPELH